MTFLCPVWMTSGAVVDEDTTVPSMTVGAVITLLTLVLGVETPPWAGFQGRRSRSRDDLTDLERDRGRGGRDAYDDSFLREAMEKKKLGEQQRGRSRERLDSESDRSDRYRGPHGGPPPLPHAPLSGNPNRHGNHSNFPPPPPHYTEDNDSLASSKKSNLKKVREPDSKVLIKAIVHPT